MLVGQQDVIIKKFIFCILPVSLLGLGIEDISSLVFLSLIKSGSSSSSWMHPPSSLSFSMASRRNLNYILLPFPKCMSGVSEEVDNYAAIEQLNCSAQVMHVDNIFDLMGAKNL